VLKVGVCEGWGECSEDKGEVKSGAVGKNVVVGDVVCGPAVAVSGGWGWLCNMGEGF
jgi:hypothetical protein